MLLLKLHKQLQKLLSILLLFCRNIFYFSFIFIFMQLIKSYKYHLILNSLLFQLVFLQLILLFTIIILIYFVLIPYTYLLIQPSYILKNLLQHYDLLIFFIKFTILLTFINLIPLEIF